MEEEDLVELLAEDPTTNSFALTLLNFGHEVWLMDRRPTLASQANPFRGPRKIRKDLVDKPGGIFPTGLGAIQKENGRNPKYWNFSLDEQASCDLPELVDFVLEKTKCKKVTLLGHSTGGAIILMALADGKLSKDKVQHAMLWAPAMDLGHSRSNPLIKSAPIIGLILFNYLGGVLPTQLTPVAQALLSKLCSPKPIRLACQMILLDVLGGEGGSKQKIEPEFFVSWPIPTGSRELVHLTQSIVLKSMHHFDYLSPVKNLQAYGTLKAPIYNVSNINLESISLWTGNTDNLVTVADSKSLLKRLKVPVEVHLVGGEQADFFQHYSFILHSNVSRLLNIPALRSLERADESLRAE